jgi:hypothetical protein
MNDFFIKEGRDDTRMGGAHRVLPFTTVKLSGDRWMFCCTESSGHINQLCFPLYFTLAFGFYFLWRWVKGFCFE